MLEARDAISNFAPMSCFMLFMGFHGAQARLRHLSYAAPVFVDITRSVYQVNNVTSSEPESLRMGMFAYVCCNVYCSVLVCQLTCLRHFKTTRLILYDSVCESAARMVKGL